MKKIVLKANTRKILGRKVKKLRQDSILPANVYGKKIKSQALQINLKDFLTVYKQAGETSVVDLIIDEKGAAKPVLIHGVQTHPVSDEPLHVDLRQIDLKEKVQVAIPLELVGESPGVTKGGVLVQVMDEIEVEALPTDLPEKIEINISKLEEIGQSVTIGDLKVDSAKIKILADVKQMVVNIEEPAKEEVEEKPAEEAAPAEGEAPAEEAKPGEVREEKPAEGKEETKAADKTPAKPETKPEEKK